MADDTGTQQGTEQGTQPPATDELGEAGQRALATERASRKAAETAAKALQKELDDERAKSLSEGERATKAAADEARAQALAEATPRIVRAEFKAAAKGVLTAAQTDALLEDLDLSKYVTASGDVDEDKIERKVKALAPATGRAGGFPGLGQGQHEPVKLTAWQMGEAEADRRYGPKK